jgi:hypothetical protein
MTSEVMRLRMPERRSVHASVQAARDFDWTTGSAIGMCLSRWWTRRHVHGRSTLPRE